MLWRFYTNVVFINGLTAFGEYDGYIGEPQYMLLRTIPGGIIARDSGLAYAARRCHPHRHNDPPSQRKHTKEYIVTGECSCAVHAKAFATSVIKAASLWPWLGSSFTMPLGLAPAAETAKLAAMKSAAEPVAGDLPIPRGLRGSPRGVPRSPSTGLLNPKP